MSMTVEEISSKTLLSPREAEVFELRMRENLTREEAGQKLDIQASTVQTVENRIKNKREVAENTTEIFDDLE